MMHQTPDITNRVEKIARYLGHSFPTRGIDRYEDDSRAVVGFRFIGAPQGNVEFDLSWIASLPSDEDGVAQAMHLRHVCAEINETAPGQRVIFNADGMRREAVSA